MWPSKKKKEHTMHFEKCLEIEFSTTWTPGKKEVVIITNNGPIKLNDKSEFFIEISSDRTHPLKMQIVPDFDNRKLNFFEIIDTAIKQDDKKGIIKFEGVRIENRTISIGEYLKNWDERIEDLGNKLKKYEKRKNILTIILFITTFINIYLAIINSGILRYINIIAAIVGTYTIYNLWNLTKKTHEDYEEIKKLREEAFEVVKDN